MTAQQTKQPDMYQPGDNGRATAVLVLMPDPTNTFLGIPLVMDEHHRSPKWKLPGGRGEGEESPSKTGVRELLEETGVSVIQSQLFPLTEPEDRHTNTFFLYWTVLPQYQPLKDRVTVDKELVGFFSVEEVMEMVEREEFLRSHGKFLYSLFEYLRSRHPQFVTA